MLAAVPEVQHEPNNDQQDAEGYQQDTSWENQDVPGGAVVANGVVADARMLPYASQVTASATQHQRTGKRILVSPALAAWWLSSR